MRRIKEIFKAGSLAIVAAACVAAGLPTNAQASAANAPSLVISQLKITSSNGQFITLYNATDTALDMSKFQLEYFNHYDLGKATSSKLINLSGIVPPHGYFMVNDSPLLLCYQMVVDSVSLGLSSTAGLVEVLAFNQTGPGNSVTTSLQDTIGWSKTAAPGAQTLPANTGAWLQRQPLDNSNNPSVNSPGAGSWQTVRSDPANACNLVNASGNAIPTGLQQLLPAAEPPATILSASEAGVSDEPKSNAGLPAADIGLMVPKITELLPNPSGTSNDDDEEFIELYNPNDSTFDLTGFSLQSGTTTLHTYSFTNGATLLPHSFKAFYSSVTGLTLSNSGGQAKLLDPAGNSISGTAVYASAKDGLAWALANGKWYWTTKPTPDEANIIDQPQTNKKIDSSKTAAKASSKKGHAAKMAANAKKAKKPKKSKKHATHSTKTLNGQTVQNEAAKSPVHSGVLALVALAAILYGAYEYRADIANHFYRFRSYLANRRQGRPTSPRRGGD